MIFKENFSNFLKKEYENSKLIYHNKKALDVKNLKEYFKEKIFLKEFDDKNPYMNNKNYNFNIHKDLIEIITNNIEAEILFVKRATNKKDKYSGNIAFPGGRVEKSDRNSLETSIRETLEEIGINLDDINYYNNIDKENIEHLEVVKENEKYQENKNKNEILCFYLCPNTGFDLTIDFKFMVNSHFFLLIDFDKDIENKLKLQESEISEAVFVPIKFFYDIDSKENKKNLRYFNGKIFGRDCQIQKILLNHNEKYLLFGMPQRVILRFLKLSDKDLIKFDERVIFNSSFFDNYLSRILRYLMGYFSDTYNTFKLLKVLILFYVVCKISNLFNIDKINEFNDNDINNNINKSKF